MIYAIGDVHGHYEALLRLLEQIRFSDGDTLWLTGDLINRGGQSIEVLRFVARTPQIRMVLGNHDVGLLVQAQNFPEWGSGTVAEALLREEDGLALLDFLRHQPLMLQQDGVILSHAGIYPEWTAQEALRYAQEVEKRLQADDYVDFLRDVYGDEPRHWSEALSASNRYRFIINAFTRMRYLDADGGLNMRASMPPAQAGSALTPWFEADLRYSGRQYFGHWAALGHYRHREALCLDGGYAWGGYLYAWNVSEDVLAGRLAAEK